MAPAKGNKAAEKPPKQLPKNPPKGKTKPDPEVEVEEEEEEEDDDSQNTVYERQKATSQMFKDIKKGNKIDVDMALTSIFLNLYDGEQSRLEAMDKKVETLEVTMDAIEQTTEKQEERIKANERELKNIQITVYQKKLLFRDLPLHHDIKPGEKENVKQTMEIVKDLFDAMMLDYKHLPDCFRFGPPKNKKIIKSKSKVPVVSATFLTGDSMGAFMGCLKNLKGNEKYKGFKCEREMPPILRADNDLANAMAFDLRQKKEMKTKVVIEKSEIKLYAAKKGETTFKLQDFRKK